MGDVLCYVWMGLCVGCWFGEWALLMRSMTDQGIRKIGCDDAIHAARTFDKLVDMRRQS